MPPDLPRVFLVSQSASIKTTVENNVEIMRPPFSKILATPLSAVYQHFPIEGNKFRRKAAVKDYQDCDAIL